MREADQLVPERAGQQRCPRRGFAKVVPRKKYMPAGVASDSAQNSSLTAPTYHHEAGNITLLLQRLTELYPVAAQIMRQIDADAPDPPAHAGIRFADTGKQD